MDQPSSPLGAFVLEFGGELPCRAPYLRLILGAAEATRASGDLDKEGWGWGWVLRLREPVETLTLEETATTGLTAGITAGSVGCLRSGDRPRAPGSAVLGGGGGTDGEVGPRSASAAP